MLSHGHGGLIGTGSSSELDLRRVLYKKVEEAGGLKEMLGHKASSSFAWDKNNNMRF